MLAENEVGDGECAIVDDEATFPPRYNTCSIDNGIGEAECMQQAKYSAKPQPDYRLVKKRVNCRCGVDAREQSRRCRTATQSHARHGANVAKACVFLHEDAPSEDAPSQPANAVGACSCTLRETCSVPLAQDHSALRRD